MPNFRVYLSGVLALLLALVSGASGSYIIGSVAPIFPSTTTPGFVQTAEAHTAATPTSLAGSFGALPKIANVIVVGVTAGAGSIATNLTTVVTDNQGNTYTRLGFQPIGGNTVSNISLWCAPVSVSSGTFTVTATFNSNVSVGIMLLEYGNTTCNPDKYSGATTATSPYSCGTFTTGNAHDILISYLSTPGSTTTETFTAPTGFTSRNTQGVIANGMTMAIADDIVAATAAFAPTYQSSQNLTSSQCATVALLSR